jgi:hypothetical protein
MNAWYSHRLTAPTIVFFGSNDHHLPVATVNAF